MTINDSLFFTALSTKEAKESKRCIVITDSSDEDHVQPERKSTEREARRPRETNHL